MKIYHEAPISIFERVQEQTDGDYCLVHLYASNPKYRAMFDQAKKDGRTIILDNSVFELGESFNWHDYVEEILKLKPDYFVIPDVLGNMEQTVLNVDKFPKIYGCKRIGVVQGQTLDEVAECYTRIVDKVDVVAFTMAYPFIKNLDSLVAQSNARVNMLESLEIRGIINENKPHHLLGCFLPQEAKIARKLKWITSMDTSSPVMNGMLGIRFKDFGVLEKSHILMADAINTRVSEEQWKDILYNIRMFRKFANTECIRRDGK